MKTLGRLIVPIFLSLSTAMPAASEVFIRANAGWLDVAGGRTRGVGNPYRGGLGGSLEMGLGLSSLLAIGAELGPGYNQPARNAQATPDLDHAAFSSMLGNIFFRLEPLDQVTPYLFVGGGRGAYTFTYADTGKVFVAGASTRRLTNDKLTAWTIVAGFGLESPLSSWIDWGVKGRYMLNRWQSLSREGILFAFPTGDAYSVEANLKLHF